MPQDPGRAVVIGAGIGGLTAALALHARGWQVTVHERAAGLEPVGSGLGVAPNALRALDALGLGDAVRALAVRQGAGGLRRASGRWLARTSLAGIEQAFGDPVAVVHRADLVALLAERLPPGALHTGSPATLLDPGDTGPARAPHPSGDARLTHGPDRPADSPPGRTGEGAPGGPRPPGVPGRPALVGTPAGERPAELVVAADGIHSATRAAVFPHHPGPRYSGFTTWRTVVPEPPAPVPLGETWGPGALVGVLPLAGQRLYLYAAAVTPADRGAPDGDERAELLRRFGGWCAPLPELLSAAEPDAVLRSDVYEMTEPLPAFHAERVALLGDAAHAMTPFQGQGACQAVEDAVVLAHDPRLSRYTAARLPRASQVVARSRRVARAVAVSGRLTVPLRDLALALAGRLPERAMIRGAAPMFDWRPPQDHPGAGRASPG